MSSSRARRRAHGTPTNANSGSLRPANPAPTATVSRPPLSRSRESSWFAVRTGFRNAGSSAAVPSVTREVRAANADSTVKASSGARARVSPTQTESRPSSSAETAVSTSSGAVRPASRMGW